MTDMPAEAPIGTRELRLIDDVRLDLGVEIRLIPDAKDILLRLWQTAYADGAAAGRERDWRNAEGIDFWLRIRGSFGDGMWIGLVCSLCGDVQATAEGEPSDLGGLCVTAQGHMERRHADLLDGDADDR